MSESELIEQRRESNKDTKDSITSGSALNFRKATSYNYSTSAETKDAYELKEKKIRISRGRKQPDDVKTIQRTTLKTGNFVMPKIFDLNIHACLSE